MRVPTQRAGAAPTAAASPKVLVVGSGWRFTSGISYYTCRLANALADATATRVVLMRQLVPTRLYPGRARVGEQVNDLDYRPDVEVYDGVDWFWGRTLRGAERFIDADAPDVVVLQWWTGAVLHSYLRLVAHARRRGARVIMEWHEVQDPGEAGLPGAQLYVRRAIGRLLRSVDAHIVHSEHDLELLRVAYGLREDVAGGVTIVPHGPYDHVRRTAPTAQEPSADAATRPFNVLFFGVIRPYKGLEDLVEAFSSLPEDVVRDLHLTIVGETWEGWEAPLEAVAASPVRDRITVVNRYVTDAEAQEHFDAADAVVLPYRRSSSSGPLHMAMSAGLPTVVSAVGGLVEAAGDYAGITFVPPADVPAIAAALTGLPAQRGRRYADPHSWSTTVTAYLGVMERLGLTTTDVPAADRPTGPTLSSRSA